MSVLTGLFVCSSFGGVRYDPAYGDIIADDGQPISSGERGLWSVTFKSGKRLDSRSFAGHSEWTIEHRGPGLFVFHADCADVAVRIQDADDGLDLTSAVMAKTDDPVVEFEFPARLRFDPKWVDRFYMPQRGNGGPGMALKREFFEETSGLKYPSWRQVGPRPWKRTPVEERKAKVERELPLAVRASSRGKAGIIVLPCGPEWGASGENVPKARRHVDVAIRGAEADLEVVDIRNYAELMAALASDEYRFLYNMYGELVPMRSADDIAPTVSAIADYERRGGRYVAPVDFGDSTAFVPGGYLSYSFTYPNLFLDFCQLKAKAGKPVSLYCIRPRPRHEPWRNAIKNHFVASRLGCGGDSRGGYIDHVFQIWGEKDKPFFVPTMRLSVGRGLDDALADYARANDLNRSFAEKVPLCKVDAFKKSAIVTVYGKKAAECLKTIERISPPSFIHISNYLKGGFDKEYPDHLPTNAERFGTDADHRAFIDSLRKQGYFYMPYTNPTWWCDHPRGPTFQAAGESPLLITEDGGHNHEIYKEDGWTTCFWHPAVIAANRKTVTQFTTEFPVDVLFQDQCGARRWRLDFNPAAPSPTAYTEGLLSQVEEDAARIPLATEDGWDKVANEEAIVCGATWTTVPRHLDPIASRKDYHMLQKELISPETWEIEPLIQRLMHEKCLFYCHDLSGYVFCDRLVAWNLALGYGFNVDVSGSFLEDAARQEWCAYVQDLQKRVASRIALQPLRAWRHERPVTLRREDDGVVVAKWGDVDVAVNLGDVSREIGGHRLAPYGYFISAPGLVARYLDGGKPEIMTEKTGE